MSEFAVVSLLALIFHKISANSFSLKFEKLLGFFFTTYIYMFSFSCTTLTQNLWECILNFFCNLAHLL